MTRLAVAILITVIALGSLIILAGRTDWYGLSYQLTSDAIEAVTDEDRSSDAAPAVVRTLSDPETWSPDFMRGALPSPACPTDTLRNVRTRMAAIGPYELGEFERTVAYYSSTGDQPGERIPTYNRVSDLVRRSATAADRIYVFAFNALTADGGGSGFSGYFVSRGDCIVHVQVTSDDN